MNSKKVIVLGGGVAGMSAAQELVERGYQVEVYERNPIYVGGKAKSVLYDGKNKNQQYANPLPGEHGFRFFPGYYKHVTDTMKRIPFYERGKEKTVFDNLVSVSREMLTRSNQSPETDLPPIITNASFPKTLSAFKVIWTDIFGTNTLLTKYDLEFFAERVWQVITSCDLRRDFDYERISWWEYTKADNPQGLFSQEYIDLLVKGLLHTLVAAHAETVSTKTAANTFLQLVFCMTDPSVNTDRVFNGPTTDRWLKPWYDYLTKANDVKYFQGREVSLIKVNTITGIVESVTVMDREGNASEIDGDYFILAVPLERAGMIIEQNPDLVKVDKTLGYIVPLASNTNWMNGIQFYLNQDVKINNGHIICSDTNWALTAFSQIQFWSEYDIQAKGNGKIKGLLSVDISEFFQPGNFNHKKASECSDEEIMEEVWAQLKMSFNTAGQTLITDDMREDWYLDRDITSKSKLDAYGLPFPVQNSENESNKLLDLQPLLVNTANTWSLRPEANCGIPNLFFASDYVRTFTDLATMEGANEAARRAVNSLLSNDSNPTPNCNIWPLEEPLLFKPLKWYDKSRWMKGMPWTAKIPWWLTFAMFFWSIFCAADSVVKYIVSRIFPDKADLKANSRRMWFIFGSMAVAIGCLILAALKFHGWQSAALWGFGFSGIYLAYAIIFNDQVMMRILIFTGVAGFTELLADNWLVVYTKTLHYPFEPRLLSSPTYMPFAWIVVLTQIGYIGYIINKKYNLLTTSVLVGLLGCCVIPFYEFLAINAEWWSYSDAPMVAHVVPVYILVAEGLLMLSVPELFNKCETASLKLVTFLGFIQGLIMWLACIVAFHLFG